MTTVIKRGGRKQDFSAYKIRQSVSSAAKDAGLPLFQRWGLVMQVANPVIAACQKKESIRSSAIRTMVVKKLQRKSKAAASAWKKYESKHRR